MNIEPDAEGLFTLEYQDRTLPNDTIEHLFNKITALHNQKDSLLTLFSRAVLKKKLQDYNGAIEDYNTIIKVRPNFSQAYFNRANTRYDALQLLRSINEHNNTMSIDATSPTSVIKRKSSTPSFDQIMKDYQKCIELDPQFCYAYFNMANVQARQKEFTGAIINYTRAILLEPKFAEAYYNRGIIYLYIHEKEGGCSDLSKAGEYGIPKAYDAIRKFCNK